jgi:hypothetical protein
MQITRAFKGEGIAYSVRISMMLEAVLEFRSKCDLGGFSVLELVDKAGGGGDQTATSSSTIIIATGTHRY